MPRPQPKKPPANEPLEPSRWRPLPPPRKNKPLLILAALLLLAWIGFLLFLALRG
jgi:hypothetical protein